MFKAYIVYSDDSKDESDEYYYLEHAEMQLAKEILFASLVSVGSIKSGGILEKDSETNSPISDFDNYLAYLEDFMNKYY